MAHQIIATTLTAEPYGSTWCKNLVSLKAVEKLNNMERITIKGRAQVSMLIDWLISEDIYFVFDPCGNWFYDVYVKPEHYKRVYAISISRKFI